MTFADRLFKLMQAFVILDWNKRLVPFTPNIPQQIFWRKISPALNAGKRVWPITLKARREGMSTLIQLLLFAYGFYCGNGETLTLAHEGESSKSIFEIQRRVWMNFAMSKSGEPPQKEIRIASPGGEVLHRVTTAGAEAKGRGTSPIALHLSEVAFWPFPETMTSVLNSMPPPHIQNIVAVESTANGKSGRGRLFYESWQMAEQGLSSMIPVFLSCLDLPDYRIAGGKVDDPDEDEKELRDHFGADDEQLAWFRFVLYDQCNGDPMLRRQEYPWTPEIAFVSSGLPAFDPSALNRQKVNARPPDRICTILADGRLLDRKDGELHIWKHNDGTWPNAMHRYVCGSDSAPGGVFEDLDDKGDTRSWTADFFLDVDTGEQVGEWYGPQVGRQHAFNLYTMVSKVFPHALCAIECNSEGGRIMQADMREQYHYSHFHPWKGKRDKVRPSRPVVWGWECVSPSARILTDDLRWVEAVHIKEGESIIGCSEFQIPGKARVRHLCRQEVVAINTFVAPMVEVTLENGVQTQVSNNHPFLVKKKVELPFDWVLASNLKPGYVVKYIPTWSELRTYEAGRLSAFLDGEGHLSQGKPNGLQMLISQAEGPLADEIAYLWKLLGFDSTFKWVRHKDRPQEKPVATCGVIRMPEVLRALGSLRPSRLLRSFRENVVLGGLTIKSMNSARVVSVEDIGDGPVIGLTTSPDHTLIADGIVGHNTNVYSRGMMRDNAQYLLAKDAVTIRSKRLLSQLSDMTATDTGRYDAEIGRDDLALAALIAWESWQENFRGKRYDARTPNNEERIEQNLRGMGIKFIYSADQALDDHIKKVMRGQNAPWKLRKV